MAIVGGSVIGLATALKAASAGFTVTVYDPSLSWANSAGWCAGGMLGGITEAWPGEDEQLRLGAASLRHWPGFCLLYTSPSPRDQRGSRMPSSA